MYYINGQMFQRSEGGHERAGRAMPSSRRISRTGCPSAASPSCSPEPADPAGRGVAKPYDQVHIGVGAAGFGNVLVGLYCIWHNDPSAAKDLFH